MTPYKEGLSPVLLIQTATPGWPSREAFWAVFQEDHVPGFILWGKKQWIFNQHAEKPAMIYPFSKYHCTSYSLDQLTWILPQDWSRCL
jgi:hypothetical protein